MGRMISINTVEVPDEPKEPKIPMKERDYQLDLETKDNREYTLQDLQALADYQVSLIKDEKVLHYEVIWYSEYDDSRRFSDYGETTPMIWIHVKSLILDGLFEQEMKKYNEEMVIYNKLLTEFLEKKELAEKLTEALTKTRQEILGKVEEKD
jgi:hypothetical protein